MSVAILREVRDRSCTALRCGVASAQGHVRGDRNHESDPAQIDALRAWQFDPTSIWVVTSCALAMMGSIHCSWQNASPVASPVGYFVAIFLLDVKGTYEVANMVRGPESRDISMGLAKGVCLSALLLSYQLPTRIDDDDREERRAPLLPYTSPHTLLFLLIAPFFPRP